MRSLTRAAGTLLINDETHTFSAGPGGMTGDLGLEPDIVTLGKAIAGGIPIGAYGLSGEVAAAVAGRDDVDLIDTGGVGGTLAGNALSMAAARATLSSVLTDDAFVRDEGAGRPLHGRASSRSSTRTGCPGRSSSSAPGPSTASRHPPRAPAGSPTRPATRSSRTTCTWRWPTAGCC